MKALRLTALLLALVMIAGVLPAEAVSAPVAENMELCTYRGTSVGGRLSASDAQGRALRYKLTTEPAKGSVRVEEDGHFVYTPAEGKRGRDYFGFRAVNVDGIESQEGTVIIRIEKQRSTVRYSDTEGLACAYAAQKLCDDRILCGECVAGHWLFEPEREITRGEYLAMCLKASGTECLCGVQRTGCTNDAELPAWVKPYISTALLNDCSAEVCAENTSYDSDAAIGKEEAAVLLHSAFRITALPQSVKTRRLSSSEWSAAAVAGLIACGVFTEQPAPDELLTRGEAAMMLVKAMALRNAE